MAFAGGPGYPGAPPPGGFPGGPAGGYGGAPQQMGGYGGAPQHPGGGYGGPPPPGGYQGVPPHPGGYPAGAPQGYGGQPQVDPQIQSWFAAVDGDRSGKISALELQQALVNGNWSHFNQETCRLMISMFDRDFSGTIDLYEFQALWHYIQQWKQTFERHDSNRTGSIEGVELQQAFQAMGYNVSPQFVQTAVIKFDTYARRGLTLDNFIQACTMLKCLTDAFKQRDASMTGSVRMGYEDFMTLAVLNKA